MKKSILYLFAALLLFSACGEDEEPIINNGATFSYDGNNQTAPILEAGEHILAARFPAALTSPFNGQTLDRVEFFLLDIPALVEVRIYGAGSANSTGDLLYTADLTNDLRANSWIGHALTDPVAINGEDLWIAVRVIHNFDNQSIGCDVGPAVNNGDLILSSPSPDWESFRDYTNGQVNINWNIRGFVD